IRGSIGRENGSTDLEAALPQMLDAVDDPLVMLLEAQRFFPLDPFDLQGAGSVKVHLLEQVSNRRETNRAAGAERREVPLPRPTGVVLEVHVPHPLTDLAQLLDHVRTVVVKQNVPGIEVEPQVRM